MRYELRLTAYDALDQVVVVLSVYESGLEGSIGAERCLFGSNFPVEKLWTEYTPLAAAFRAALAPLGAKAERAALHDTAIRVYRLN